jgi:hypothetical protein
MDSRERLVQRSVDGELGAAEHAAMTHIMNDRSGIRRTMRHLEALDRLMRTSRKHHSERMTVLLDRVCARIPTTPPERHQHIRLMDITFGIVVLPLLVYCYNAVGSTRGLASLVFATASVIAGLVLVLMTTPMLTRRTTLLQRLFSRRVNVGSRADVVICRLIGITVFIGGAALWLGR